MLRISTNFVTTTAIGDLQRLSDQQARLQQNIATGRRLIKPSDDPAAAGRVLDRQIEQERVGNYSTATAAAKSRSDAGLAGLTQLQKLVSRVDEVAALAGGAGPQGMRAYGAEIGQLLEQAVNVANSRFGTDYIFAGTAVTTKPFPAERAADGSITRVTYAGNDQDATIPMGDGRAIAPAPGAATTNPAMAELFNRLVSLRDALRSGDRDTVQSLNITFVQDEDSLIDGIGTLAAVQTRIESNQAQLTARSNDLQRLISTDTDADLATSMVRLTETQTAYQAALSATANLFKSNLLDYLK